MSRKFYETKYRLLEQLTGALSEVQDVLEKLQFLEKSTVGCDKDFVKSVMQCQATIEECSDYFISETDAVECLISDFG